ncbi:Integral membrane protein [compost metagenome]
MVFLVSMFSSQAVPEFVPFSTAHLIAFGIMIILVLSLFWGRMYIRNHRGWRLGIRYGLAFVLLLTQVSLNIWYVAWGVWDVKYTLPLELCSISLLLSIVMLCTRSRMLYHVLLFAGICGPLQAILTPNLSYGFPHFRFFEFFAAHTAIILAPLYMTWIEQYRPSWKSIGWSMLFLNILALVVGILNMILGSNYMFLQHKPDTPSLLDVLGPYPYYLLVEEAIALLMFVIMYAVFFVVPKRLGRNPKLEQERKHKLESSGL